MLKPRENRLISGFFDRYISWIIRRHFKAVRYNDCEFDNERSILLIANHFSWWDGFLLYHLNKMIFKKKFHIMVLEETVKQVSFLKYLGAFSITKNSRQVIESLNYAAGLLLEANNLVVIFPQGRLYSNFTDGVDFQKGTAYIASRAGQSFQYVFSATFMENFQYKKPSVNIYLKVLNVNEIVPNDLQAEYLKHYRSAKQQQTAIVV